MECRNSIVMVRLSDIILLFLISSRMTHESVAYQNNTFNTKAYYAHVQ